MKAFAFLLALPLIPCFAPAVACANGQQDVAPDKSVFRAPVDILELWVVWDDARSELVGFTFYQRREDSSGPLIRIYSPLSGERRSIDVFKDFPNASFISVDGFAIGPNGSILLACEVGDVFTSDRILLYDANSALIRNLSAESYDVRAVAMDEQENIYILGTHEDEHSSEESYPLIVKYDSYGKISQEMLPRSPFLRFFNPTAARIDDSILFPSFLGSSSLLAVNAKEIDVYLPAAGAIIALDHSGNIQRRVDAADRLSEFARTRGYKNLQVTSNYFSPAGDLWLQGFVSEPLDGSAASTPFSQFLLRLTPEGQIEALYEHTAHDASHAVPVPRLIGFTQSNEPVAFSQGDQADTVLIQRNPY
jgi:hypothetical protein